MQLHSEERIKIDSGLNNGGDEQDNDITHIRYT